MATTTLSSGGTQTDTQKNQQPPSKKSSITDVSKTLKSNPDINNRIKVLQNNKNLEEIEARVNSIDTDNRKLYKNIDVEKVKDTPITFEPTWVNDLATQKIITEKQNSLKKTIANLNKDNINNQLPTLKSILKEFSTISNSSKIEKIEKVDPNGFSENIEKLENIIKILEKTTLTGIAESKEDIDSKIRAINSIITNLKKLKTERALNALEIRYAEFIKSLGDHMIPSIITNKLNIQEINKLLTPYYDALTLIKRTGFDNSDISKLQQGDNIKPFVSSPDQSSNPSDQSQSSSPDQQPPKEKEDVIALIFNMLYFVGGIVSAILVVVLFILASFDLLKFNINSLSQYISLLSNPNMYNKDTQDFKALMYYRNSTDTEPYTIFGQQELIKVMFRLATTVVGLFMFQVLILVVLFFIYRVVRGEPLEMGNIDFAKSTKYLGTVLVMVILAFVWTGLYQARFLNKIQPSIIYTHTNIEQVKNYIYDNLTTNEQFLNNLINGDLNECITIMNQQTNDNRISRMIYTMSLYNFFKINISENEEAFNTVIRDIFSIAEIRVRAVNPINYMYYNQNVFLPNLYPILRPYIYGSNKAISSSDPTRDKIIRLDITQRINETNKRLMTLYKVPERKEQLSTYFIVAFVISLVFLFIVYGLYRENIRSLLGGDVITKLKEIIMGVLSAKQTNLGTTNTVPTTSSGEPQSPSSPK